VGTGERSSRPRGRPPRITRAQIVLAARSLDPADLRMSDVARVLEVQPAALYHHVRDREELLQLVAAQVLEETPFDDYAPGPDATWQDWVLQFATALRSAFIENPVLLRYVRLTTIPTQARLDRVEEFVSVLADTGFSITDIQHTIVHIYTLVLGETWQQVIREDEGDPQSIEFTSAVQTRPAGDVPHLREMTDSQPDADAHFAFAISCLVAGLAVRLQAQPQHRSGTHPS
jgi:TetR/AcrR family tetracycline transcriptional repressor